SERVSNAQFTSQTKGTFDNLLSSIDYIVVVIILAAGALAVIVLYNLTNININERNKELATLRVLGFHHREVGSYIFREISILSLIGTLVGLVLGIFLFDFVILTAESPEFMFGRDLQPSAFVFAALLTLFFSALVDVIMYQKLKKIQMVESLKAVD
ncbi:MAG: ABC transporter permease, partial [Desulfitobacterium sp.]|nr:ABC transporter permease [Desulfitobacterium sp.]